MRQIQKRDRDWRTSLIIFKLLGRIKKMSIVLQTRRKVTETYHVVINEFFTQRQKNFKDTR